MSDYQISVNESVGMFEISRSVKPWDHLRDEVVAPMVDAAGRVADGKEVWLCGSGIGPMRPGKPLDLTCIFAHGHFEACGRYVLVRSEEEE